MNSLLIFFAIQLAVVIFSIALQKIFRCPVLVAGIILAVGIIVTFVISDLNFLVATLIYTIISYITAVITCLFMRYFNECNNDGNTCSRQNNNRIIRNNNAELLTIDSNFPNGNTENLLTITSNSNINNSCNCNNNENPNVINGVIRIENNDNNSCNCNCNNNSNEVAARINVVPNNANNGRTGCICGRYRRR